jgi:hypothetical protein
LRRDLRLFHNAQQFGSLQLGIVSSNQARFVLFAAVSGLTMPWILRFAIGSLFLFFIGAVMIACACMSTGWETLSWFAAGCVTAGAGLILTTLLSILSALIHQAWRRFSLDLMSASVLLFLLLLIFAKFA